MPPSQCTVTFADTEGLRHSVDVTAESLYEAAALALSTFRNSAIIPPVGPVSELEITVRQPETRHRVRVSKLEQWLESNGRNPKEQMLKMRLREVLTR